MHRNDNLQSESFGSRGNDANLEFQQKSKIGIKNNGACRIPGLGIILTVTSSLFFALNVLCAKMIDLHPMQIVLFRSCIQFWIVLPFLFQKRRSQDILGHEGIRLFLWLHGFICAGGLLFMYLSLDYLSVGNTVTVSYLSMVMTPFIARIFLKDSLAVYDLIFAVVSLSGVVLIAQPSFLFPVREEQSLNNGLGIIYAVLCAAFLSLSLVTIRKIGRDTYALLNVFYYGVCGSILMMVLFFTLHEFQLPCQQDLPLIFLMGISGVLALYFLTLALRIEQAGTVGILRSSQIIFVYIMQVTVLGDIPNMLDLIGAALVLSSSVGIGVRIIVNDKKRSGNVVTSPAEN